MIESVTREGAVFAELPHKFEAGTVNAAGAAGLQAAIEYMLSVGFETMHERETALVSAADKISAVLELVHSARALRILRRCRAVGL